MLMNVSLPEISKFHREVNSIREYSQEELLTMPYDDLYALHGQLTISRLEGRNPKQLGFGNLTTDQRPNSQGEAALHFAALPDNTVQKKDFSYETEGHEDLLKLSLMGMEDMINRLRYYQSGKATRVPKYLTGKTNSASADNAIKMGFKNNYNIDKTETLHGLIRFIIADVESMIQNLPELETRFNTLKEYAERKKGITLQQIRAEIIYECYN